MGNLNANISDRLTPSVPIEITFQAQPIATGRKFTTLFGHKAATGSTAPDYTVYQIINIGSASAAQAEVDAIAGAGSQISAMTAAFVNSNLLAGRGNFPSFRVVLLPYSELHFGSSGQALTAVQNMRSDMVVSCYPTSDDTNLTTLMNFATTISGIDRDLNGQFGTFVQVASLDALTTQTEYDINSRSVVAACFPDSNTAEITTTATTTTDANADILTLPVTTGVYPGAVISMTGVPTGTTVEQVLSLTQVQMSAAATAIESAQAVTLQNMVSQPPEIVAAAHAAGMMSLNLPYNPMQGMVLGGIIPQQIITDRIIIDPNGSSEAALVAGLSPLSVQPGNTVAYIRTRTTYTTLPGEIAATAYIDWQDIVALYDFREDMYQVSQQPPFNNNPGGTKASAQIAAFFKDELIRVSNEYQDDGAFQNVKQLAPFFQVVPSSTSPGRFDFVVPEDVIPGLMVIAGNIVAVSDLASFLQFQTGSSST